MSTDIFLDPEQVNQMEPIEGDEYSRAMLAPSAVPYGFALEYLDKNCIHIFSFAYAIREAAGSEEALDDGTEPRVMVRTSALTQRVLDLRFSPSVSVDDLGRIAERIAARAERIDAKAKRLSFKLAASLIGYAIPLARRVTSRP
jgi:hypothetical protein